MSSFDDPDVDMCPFLRSVRQHPPGEVSHSYVNACYLQRRPCRTNLLHALHTQANLCMSADHVMCPRYRVGAHALSRRARVAVRA
jgi:hypothetical protein